MDPSKFYVGGDFDSTGFAAEMEKLENIVGDQRHKYGGHVKEEVMQAYVKPQADEIWFAGSRRASKNLKPKIVVSESKGSSVSPFISKNSDQSEIASKGKGGGTKGKRGGKGMSLAEAAEGRLLITKGVPCNCQAARHKLVNNCLSCGKIVCEQEGEGPCNFCGALVLREGSDYANLGGTALPFSETEAVAYAFKDRLVEYDRTSSQRTNVIDDQNDYFQVNGDAWLSEEEKLLLKKRQEELQQAEEDQKKKVVVTIDLVGRKVIAASDSDLEMKTSILGGTSPGEKDKIVRIKPNPYISESPVFIDVNPHKNGGRSSLSTNTTRQPNSCDVIGTGRVQHDGLLVKALGCDILRDRHIKDSWLGPKLQERTDQLSYADEDCFQECTTDPDHVPSARPSPSGFDICESGRHTILGKDKPVVLSPSILVQKQAERAMLRAANHTVEVLLPGMVLMKGWLSPHDQVEIVRKCSMLGIESEGFYQPAYGNENRMHLLMMCLGKHWNPIAKSYESRRTSFDNAPAQPVPSIFVSMVSRALTTAQDALQDECKKLNMTDKRELLPDMQPEVCIVNFYGHSGKLGMHQDKNESPESLRKGIPVVSFSIGDSAEFLYGKDRNVEKVQQVTLESGDVLIFGGASRMIFHGVKRVLPQTAPPWLIKETNMKPGRLNLTFRQL
eukprot:c27689_g1_i1 orf=352-2367(-)